MLMATKIDYIVKMCVLLTTLFTYAMDRDIGRVE